MAKVNGEHEWARAPPPSLPIWRRLANIVYDPEEKSFFGRTPKRWGVVLTFYMVFYAVLALMFSACMAGLFLTLDTKTPSYTLDSITGYVLFLSYVKKLHHFFCKHPQMNQLQSCIMLSQVILRGLERLKSKYLYDKISDYMTYKTFGNNPGVAYRPRSPNDGFLVTLNVANSSVVDHYVNQLTEFLRPYQKSKQYQFDECSVADNFGYPESPCFFIKLNKIFNWKPECYDASALPQDMPTEIQELIKAEQGPKTQKIWMSCWEEKSNMTKIEYPWGVGVSADNFPFRNEVDYISPLLAVRVTPPANKLVVIRCRFWAKNIIYNKSLKEPSGYTRIQLIIENKTSVSDVTN
ncbi:hypothetical protein ACJJTC_002764 [Scirpophaga incertulas]